LLSSVKTIIPCVNTGATMVLKRLLFLIVLITQSTSFAITLRILDQQKRELLVVSETLNTATTHVYSLTKAALDQASLPYESSEQGFYSINNLAPQTSFISDTEFKTYGWCFTVNKVLAQTQANETYLNDTDAVEWFYGYAHYRNGEWLGMCELDAQ